MQTITIPQRSNYRNILFSVLWFTLSALVTGWFIAQKIWLYGSVNLMILSGSIAAVKWMVQIVAALILLKENKWQFICRIGLVCFIGSLVLLSYHLVTFIPISGWYQFLATIFLAIVMMTVMYYRAVKRSDLKIVWFWGWLAGLTIAVGLQLLLVF